MRAPTAVLDELETRPRDIVLAGATLLVALGGFVGGGSADWSWIAVGVGLSWASLAAVSVVPAGRRAWAWFANTTPGARLAALVGVAIAGLAVVFVTVPGRDPRTSLLVGALAGVFVLEVLTLARRRARPAGA